MISLGEALKLCHIGDERLVHLCTDGDPAYSWWRPMTGREIRERFDVQATMVTGIDLYFCYGECEGLLFTIKENDK